MMNEEEKNGNGRRAAMTVQVMKKILEGIQETSYEISITGNQADSDLLFIQTYNKLRQKAIDNGWIDDDIVIELDINNKSIFGEDKERMDIIGAAATIFMSALV
jgi:methylmalonyl-CoA mutase N-terminal domain/subunit